MCGLPEASFPQREMVFSLASNFLINKKDSLRNGLLIRIVHRRSFSPSFVQRHIDWYLPLDYGKVIWNFIIPLSSKKDLRDLSLKSQRNFPWSPISILIFRMMNTIWKEDLFGSNSTIYEPAKCLCRLQNSLMKYVRPLSLFQDLLKTEPLERGRLLGLDVGDKYVGLAVSDPHNKIASPLSVLLRKKTNIELMATDFQSLISELSLAGFIIGYPFARQRTSPDAVQVKLFIDDLCKTGKLEGIKYTFWDECFTSKNVELLLKPLNLHPVHSKTIIDKFAAVQILQGYIDYVNKKVKLEQKGVTA